MEPGGPVANNQEMGMAGKCVQSSISMEGQPQCVTDTDFSQLFL